MISNNSMETDTYLDREKLSSSTLLVLVFNSQVALINQSINKK